jgi:cobalamin biosynthesis Mg chelatase CobN
VRHDKFAEPRPAKQSLRCTLHAHLYSLFVTYSQNSTLTLTFVVFLFAHVLVYKTGEQSKAFAGSAPNSANNVAIATGTNAFASAGQREGSSNNVAESAAESYSQAGFGARSSGNKATASDSGSASAGEGDDSNSNIAMSTGQGSQARAGRGSQSNSNSATGTSMHLASIILAPLSLLGLFSV